MPVIPAILRRLRQENCLNLGSGGCSEPMVPLHSSLGERVRPCLKKRERTKKRRERQRKERDKAKQRRKKKQRLYFPVMLSSVKGSLGRRGEKQCFHFKSSNSRFNAEMVKSWAD